MRGVLFVHILNFGRKPPFPSLILFTLIVLLSTAYAKDRIHSSPNVALVVSDIHFNPMADPGLVTKLEAAEPSQWQTILSRSKSTSFSQYGQDTNWWLLRSSLDQM